MSILAGNQAGKPNAETRTLDPGGGLQRTIAQIHLIHTCYCKDDRVGHSKVKVSERNRRIAESDAVGSIGAPEC